jgi:UDP-N-acetylglucosamine/UDP-N-acetylgalactosamine diphosphorylase
MEERSSAAHTVALKQTILFPFVTLGSLINFCDCLMAGGNSRKNHSEVGSSYIHFNYTPNQDKATASLLGDVPRGVMLNQLPIFLGGQGGMVGPCRMEFGNVVAAGSIIRKDEPRPGRLIQESARKSVNIPFTNGLHLTLRRIMANNITYIANLLALMQWYKQVRRLFVGSRFPEALLDGLCQTLDTNIQERVNRLIEYCGLMPVGQPLDSVQTIIRNELHQNATRVSDILPSLQQVVGEEALRDIFLARLQKTIQADGDDYIAVIQSLPISVSEYGIRWLQSIVSQVVSGLTGIFPSLHA